MDAKKHPLKLYPKLATRKRLLALNVASLDDENGFELG
jgi:hypothetical protein